MRKPMPQVQCYMTRMPLTVSADTPLVEAVEMMRQNGIRHLPVESNRRVVGVLSDRGTRAAVAAGWMRSLKVADVMADAPYTASPEAPLDEVADAMAQEKFGCAVICDGEGHVHGIFTTTDACRALRELLETAYPE